MQAHESAATLHGLEVSGGVRMDGEKQIQMFPLDFNAKSWALNKAVPWVFFGSTPTPHSLEWVKATKSVIGRITGAESAKNVLLPLTTKEKTESLLAFFQRLSSDWKSDLELPPVVWSRLAIQYWLMHGGRQDLFMKAFLLWLQNSGNVAVQIEPVSLDGQNINGVKLIEVELSAFIFDSVNLKRCIKRRVSLKPIGSRKSGKVTASKRGAKSIEEKVGSGLFQCVKRVIENAIQSRSIANLSSRLDPKSGRYQFTGRHGDLCKDILRQYQKETKPYSESTIERAVRELVASRRSWKGIV